MRGLLAGCFSGRAREGGRQRERERTHDVVVVLDLDDLVLRGRREGRAAEAVRMEGALRRACLQAATAAAAAVVVMTARQPHAAPKLMLLLLLLLLLLLMLLLLMLLLLVLLLLVRGRVIVVGRLLFDQTSLGS